VLQLDIGVVDRRGTRALKGRCAFKELISACWKTKSIFVPGRSASTSVVLSGGGVVLFDYRGVGEVTACITM
jgi:hypothetical protein